MVTENIEKWTEIQCNPTKKQRRALYRLGASREQVTALQTVQDADVEIKRRIGILQTMKGQEMKANTLTTLQVAKLLGVSSRSICYWANQGKISYTKTLGGHRKYSKEEVQRVQALMHKPDEVPELETIVAAPIETAVTGTTININIDVAKLCESFATDEVQKFITQIIGKKVGSK